MSKTQVASQDYSWLKRHRTRILDWTWPLPLWTVDTSHILFHLHSVVLKPRCPKVLNLRLQVLWIELQIQQLAIFSQRKRHVRAFGVSRIDTAQIDLKQPKLACCVVRKLRPNQCLALSTRLFPVNSGIASPHFFYPIIPLYRVHVNDSVHNYFSTIDFHILYTILHFCTRYHPLLVHVPPLYVHNAPLLYTFLLYI